MRTTATLSAILAASAFTHAMSIATEPLITTELPIVTSESQFTATVVSPPLFTETTVPEDNGTAVTISGTSVPFPILSTASGSPVPSGNSSGILPTGTGSTGGTGGTGGTGRPPVPTSSHTTGPTAGATLTTTQNSWLAMGIAVVMASLIL
ncbi:hypothetical protein MANI_000272 [Metarhizium anisopliae]